MEKLQKNLEKEFNAMTRPKPKKRTGRWTLLLVGNHGKIISSGKVVGPAILLAVISLVFAGAAGYFYFIYKNQNRKNIDLKNQVSVLQKKVNALQDEKDLIMVRLVLAESRLKINNTHKQEDKIKKTAKTSPVSKVFIKPVPGKPEKISTVPIEKVADVKFVFAVNVATEKIDTENNESTEKKRSVETAKVKMEKFTATYITDINTLRVTFIIRKNDFNLETVSGKAFVILKSDGSDQKQWIVFPKGELISGKPAKRNRGQYFSIARFKLMKFEKRFPVYPELFNNAEIYIYSTTGNLLLARTFPVAIKQIKSSEDK